MAILIVDDDPGILNAFEISLATKGYHIISAQNGRQALRIIKSSLKGAEPVNVMLADFLMPGMNGLELILSARKIKPDLEFILMTAYGNNTVKQKALKLGIGRYIEKPFTPDSLLKMIEILNSKINSG
jgi:two-component system response regulator HydG